MNPRPSGSRDYKKVTGRAVVRTPSGLEYRLGIDIEVHVPVGSVVSLLEEAYSPPGHVRGAGDGTHSPRGSCSLCDCALTEEGLCPDVLCAHSREDAL